MGKPGMGIAPGWIKRNAGWLYERVAPGGSGSRNAPPADGKSERNKRSPTYKNLLPILLLNKQDEKSFHGADFGLERKY